MVSLPPVLKRVHLIGIGGIGVSAVAKLLRKQGVKVSGSDATRSEITDELKKAGAEIFIGHVAEQVPAEADLVIYSSAIPETNAERAEARRLGILQLNNFEFLGAWTEDKQPVLVCGTHGKSTTTALLGSACLEAHWDPTVIVGSRVPFFPEGNIFFGQRDLVIIEGDEYERHFLAFHPSGVIINNIEWDHTDIFPTLENLITAFRDLLHRVRDGGLVVANADDPRIGTLIGEERQRLEARKVRIRTFGFASHADVQIVDHTPKAGEQMFALRDEQGMVSRFVLHIPGKMNVMNAAAAMTMAWSLGVQTEAIRRALGLFSGIWRRFEKVADQEGMTVISDYGHHPTAVAATLAAAKTWFPGRRLVLCFQPHHHRRTKDLFFDFISSFDLADALVLTEIYDVAGREEVQDQHLSSRDLVEAVMRHDAERGAKRVVEYASNPAESLVTLKRWKTKGDVLLVMGAGDIYKIAKQVLDS